MLIIKIDKILFGGDYNPEQWSKEIMSEDIRLFNLANVDIVTLNVFNWAMLQPDEITYDFSTLDYEIEFLSQNNKKICLATSTGAHPAWLARKYNDILRVDFNGNKRKFGGRHNSCPSSPAYKKYSVLLASKIAERYKNYDNIVAWHISNEYGGVCYCENCEKNFRIWLKQRYKTLENLNKAWNTNFWSHTFYDWDEIVAPNLLTEFIDYNRTMFQSISLDYARFNSDNILSCYIDEYNTIKKITPNIPITTNLMGFYKDLDYQKWSKYMDFISWDSYPEIDDPIEKNAMAHDFMRSLKHKPFWLMEQTPSVTNWHPYNSLKRPKVMRLLSYQAIAHGADTVMYFQMRRSIGECEKFHGALIDHVGTENTRVFKECAELGNELNILGNKLLNSQIKSDVAIVYDWDNFRAIEYSAGPSCKLKYIDEIFNYYKGLNDNNIAVDIISTDDSLDKYKIIIAPVLYMIKHNYDIKLKEFVTNGGIFITTFFSGIVDENDLVTTGGYPGKLRDLLGIWVEEIDALKENDENEFIFDNRKYPSKLLCDIMHTENAQPIAFYQKDFYRQTPVIAKNCYGKGEVFYIGTRSNSEFYYRFLRAICNKKQIKPPIDVPKQIEVTKRIKNDEEFIFILNHSGQAHIINLNNRYLDLLNNCEYNKDFKLNILPKDVFILKPL